MDVAMAFQTYQLMKAHERTAEVNYDLASVELENFRIRTRLAELRSQHEPLARLVAEATPANLRQQMFAAAHYVVYGRMPEGDE